MFTILNFRAALIFIVTCWACVSWGWPKFDTEPAGPVVPTRFVVDQQQVRMGSQCEQILLKAEARLGRHLTDEELSKNIPLILAETGESLLHIPARPRCFTGDMTVLTPTGERPIAELRPGDEVISIDLATKRPVTNKVKFVFPSQREVSRLVDLERPIDVTPQHRFLIAEPDDKLNKFIPIQDISQDGKLVELTENCGLQPVLRGRYQPLNRTELVFDLTLIGEPRNFIVRGIVVHNIKPKC